MSFIKDLDCTINTPVVLEIHLKKFMEKGYGLPQKPMERRKRYMTKKCISQSYCRWRSSKAIEQLKSGVFTTTDILTEKGVWSYPAGAFHGAGGGPC